ncbi:sugar isomerase domain-containing protein [Streptomyces sp. NBC_00887]|uniref:sugar isomerase domain-containing protein n=1 Tax=Streptomyces sp. NBC_00887 TaxID=2975859 RepID=UPI003868E998|nr:SIS domain-containing protein [Streptomyces sp. NBC_00887]WSY36283.1 SIS domain-containing protein [Streptomyces sp. NBC_00887]
MSICGKRYAEAVAAYVSRVPSEQTKAIAQAADLVVTSLRRGGIVNAFGSGHSEAVAMEIAGRAGGLVPTNRLAMRDIVLHGGEPLSVLSDPLLERDLGVAERILNAAPVQPEDAFVIISSSGVNGVVVELADIVKRRGHPLIALTSLAHSTAVPSRHPSGRKLYEFADVVLDNGAPLGDSVLELPGGGSFGAVSTITSALLAQMMVAEVVAQMLSADEAPPVYLSANIPEGDAHNNELEARYAGRLRRGA